LASTSRLGRSISGASTSNISVVGLRSWRGIGFCSSFASATASMVMASSRDGSEAWPPAAVALNARLA
jgi:hypothetical protein